MKHLKLLVPFLTTMALFLAQPAATYAVEPLNAVPAVYDETLLWTDTQLDSPPRTKAIMSTCNFPYSEPVEGEIAVVGQAIDSDRERVKVLNAFKGTDVSVGGSTAILGASLVRSYEEIYEKTSIKKGGNFGIGPFKFGRSRQYVTEVTKKQYAANFMLTFEVQLPNGKWNVDSSGGSPLTDYARSLLSNPCQFKQVFGDSFIFQTQRGARVYVAINIAFSSQANLNSFTSSTDAGFTAKISQFVVNFCSACGTASNFTIPAFNLSAAFSNASGNLSSSVKRDGTISLIAMQFGGDATRLPQILGTNGDVALMACSLDNLSACDTAFSNVLAYLATTAFADGIRNYPEIIGYLQRNYWEVDPSIQLINEVTPAVTQARNRLAENLLVREQDLRSINSTLATTLMPGHRQQLTELKAELEQNIEDLITAGFTCFSDVMNCVTNANSLLAELRGYDRNIVNPNPADGLVAYYPFNTNALDASGNGNHGTVYGATLTADRFGNANSAYSFNGTNNYIDTNLPTIDITSGHQNTIAFWMYWDGLEGSIGKLPMSFDYRYNLWLVGGTFGFNTGNGDVYGISSSGLANQWVHVVAVFTNGNLTQNTLYINGASPSLSQLISSPLAQSVTRYMRIGCFVENIIHCFGGKIDDVRIYNRALSATEVQQLYAATNTNNNQPPLALFTTSAVQGTGTLTVQLNATAANDADGTITNYAWSSSAGHTASAATASMNFTAPGNYTITLKVTDNQGATSQASKTVSVALRAPVLNAIAGNSQVTLNWAAVPGATSYNVYQGNAVGAESATPVKTLVTGTSVAITGLTNGSTYYFKITAVNAQGMSALSNEVSAKPTAALADLVVTSVTLNPAAPVTNGTFSAAVTVKNQGAGAGTGGQLRLWLNQSTAQACAASGGDKVLSVGMLTAGASQTVTFTGLAAGTSASKTLRLLVDAACATTEANETNNQFTQTYRVSSGQPDFVITALTLTPATPVANATFNLAVTVKNQGTIAADGGYLDVWANQITVPSCGTDGNKWAEVGSVAAGATKTLNFTALAAGRAGAKTLRAFLDSWCSATESNEVNNQMTKSYTVQ